jgi:hypothetical protein
VDASHNSPLRQQNRRSGTALNWKDIWTMKKQKAGTGTTMTLADGKQQQEIEFQ